MQEAASPGLRIIWTGISLPEWECNIQSSPSVLDPPSHRNGDCGRLWVQQKRPGWTWSLCCCVQRKTQEGKYAVMFPPLLLQGKREGQQASSFENLGQWQCTMQFCSRICGLSPFWGAGDITYSWVNTEAVWCNVQSCLDRWFQCHSISHTVGENVFMVWFIHGTDESGSSELLADVLKEEEG